MNGSRHGLSEAANLRERRQPETMGHLMDRRRSRVKERAGVREEPKSVPSRLQTQGH